jgi:lipoyl(octanoyl) transferase
VIERVDLGEVEYDEAVRRMAGWVAERRAGTAGDRLFLLSHPPIGRPTDADVREAVAAELTR